MAIFKPYQVNKERLTALPIVDGQIIAVTDAGLIYLDNANKKRIPLANMVKDISDISTVMITSNDVNQLKNIRGNVQEQLDEISDQLNNSEGIPSTVIAELAEQFKQSLLELTEENKQLKEYVESFEDVEKGAY